jgi:gamma-aminobutyric acid type B receptor
VYRKGIVVRASQSEFLIMLSVGVLIMGSSLIPMSLDDNGQYFVGDGITDAYAIGICMSRPWLAFIGFVITFSALFSKTWRINKFFHSSGTNSVCGLWRRKDDIKKSWCPVSYHCKFSSLFPIQFIAASFGRIRVSTIDVLTPFAVLFTLNVIILTVWTVVDPLTYIRQFESGTDLWNREIASNGSCKSEHAVAYLVALAVVNFSVVILCLWKAWQARDIRSEFAEAKVRQIETDVSMNF